MISEALLTIDSDIENWQRIQLVETMREGIDTDPQPLDDKVFEVVDGLIPVWNHELINAWRDANCPRPDDFDMEPLITADPFAIMHAGLSAAWDNYLRQLFNAYGVDITSNDDDVRQDALQACHDVLSAYGVGTSS